MKPTTKKDREDIVRDVCEGVLGAGYEWLRRYVGNEEEGILNGPEVHLVWVDESTVKVELDGEHTVTLALQVVAEVLDFVEDAPPVNEPVGGIIPRTWATVPAGWFVQTPAGEWLEVGSTNYLDHTGQQMVSLIIAGHAHAFPRPPQGAIKCRRGSLYPADFSDALDAIEGAFTTAILQDEPPGQS